MAKRNIRTLYPSCKPVVIYGLVDPRDRSLKYIGKSETPELRRKHHIWESPKNDSPKCQWIRGLLAAGQAPELLIIETVEPGGDWAAAEKRHIAAHRVGLFNQCSGGQGVPSDGRGEKWRKALAASHIDNPNRKNGHKSAAEKMRGRKQSPETIEKRAARHRGKKLSPEHIAKIRAANKGQTPSPQTIAAAVAFHKGRKHSSEHKERQRQSMLLKREAQAERQRKNWLDPEYRANHLAKRSKSQQPEHREKSASRLEMCRMDPTINAKRLAGIRAAQASAEYKEQARLRALRLWSDPAFRERMKASREK